MSYVGNESFVELCFIFFSSEKVVTCEWILYFTFRSVVPNLLRKSNLWTVIRYGTGVRCPVNRLPNPDSYCVLNAGNCFQRILILMCTSVVDAARFFKVKNLIIVHVFTFEVSFSWKTWCRKLILYIYLI